MKFYYLKVIISLVVVVLFATACDRSFPVQVVVDAGGQVGKGAPVYVDDVLAGEVQSVITDDGELVANLVIDDEQAEMQLRVGTLHLPAPNRVQLSTELVESDAMLLPRGSRIPASSSIMVMVKKYSKKSNIIAVGVALVSLFVLWLIFRCFIRKAGLIIFFIVAGVLSQVLYVNVVPFVDKGMQRFSAPSSETEITVTGSVVDVNDKQEAYSGVLDTFTGAFSVESFSSPSPMLIAWIVVFKAWFILLNVTLGKLVRIRR